MRTLTKKVLFSVLVAFLTVSCFMFVTVTVSKNTVKADSAALETEFTNNGQFTVGNTAWGGTHEFIDGTSIGGTGAVLKTTNVAAGTAGFRLNFTDTGLRVSAVESIVVRVKVAPFTLGTDEFRTSKLSGSDFVNYGKADDLSNWFDYTLNASTMAQLNNDGMLGYTDIVIRAYTTGLILYVDSITIVPSKEAQFTNNYQFEVGTTNWGFTTYEFIDGTSIGGEGAVLQANTVAGIAGFKLDFTGKNILASSIDSIKIKLKATNFVTGTDFFRTALDTSSQFVDYTGDNLNNWFEYTLNAASMAQLTNNNGTLGSVDIVIRAKSSNNVIVYFDSVTITTKAEVAAWEAEFTNNGQFAVTKTDWNGDYEFIDGTSIGGTGAVLKASVLASGTLGFKLDFTDTGLLASKVDEITVRVKADNYTVGTDVFRTAINNGTNYHDYSKSDNLNNWFDYTLDATSMAQLTNNDGTLGSVDIVIRAKTAGLIAYFDSVTITLKMEESDFTGGEFSVGNTNWGGTHTFIDGTTVGGTGAVLKAIPYAGTAGFRLDFTGKNILASNIESIVVRVKADNFTLGTDFVRMALTSGNYVDYPKTDDLSDWFDYTLNEATMTKLTNQDGTLGYIDIVIRAYTSGLIAYFDSVTITEKVNRDAEFTNGEFSIGTTNWGTTYEIIDAVDGATGVVLKAVASGVAGFKLDFTDTELRADDVESIKVRVRADNFGFGTDFFRTALDTSSQFVDYGTGDDLNNWKEYTLNAQTMAQLTNQDGTLGSVDIVIRSYGSGLIAYFDYVTIIPSFTNGQFEVGKTNWNSDYEYIDGTTVGGTGAVLKAYTGTGVAGFKLNLTNTGLCAEDVASIVVRVKAENFTLGTDEFRTSNDTGAHYSNYGKTDDLSVWHDYTLNAASMAQLTNNDGTLGSTDIVIRTNTAGLILYVDSVTINVIMPTVVCQGIANDANNNIYEENTQKYRTLLTYDKTLGSAANSTEVVSTTGMGIKLNGVSLALISGASINYGHGGTYIQIRIPKSYQDALTGNIILEVIKGTTFEDQVLDGAKFALIDGQWKRVYDVTFSRVRWNDEDAGNNYDGKKGILLQFNEYLSTVANEINGGIRATNFASTVGEHIYLGGQKLSTLPGALVSYHSQDNLFIYADNMSAYRTFTIEEGTPVLNAILPELNLYYNGDSKWTTTNRTISPVTYSNIQWNNIGYQVYEGKAGVLLNFGTNLSLNTAEINGGSATANLKDIYGSSITLNGETLDNIANAELAYYNTMFVWIYAPGMTTWENHVPTIEIAANSPFMDATLSAVTIYFYDNEWKEVAPKVLTINYSAGEYSRIRLFENSVTVSSEYLTGILSDSYDHATVLSWTIGSTDYFYGDTSNVNATATVNITTVLDFYTLAGAYIRLSNDGVTGLRFESRIKTVDYNALLDSCDDVEFGTYIAPKVLLDAYLVANDGTTFRDYFAQAQGSGNSSKYVKVVNQGIYNRETYEEDGYVQFFGSLGNIYEINYYTKFVGVGYAKITIGGNTYVVFGATSLVNNTRTVYDIAKIAYNDTSSDFTDSQLASIKVYIDAVAELTYKLGTLSVNEVVTEREYSSPYQASHTDGYYYLARFGSVELPKTILINGKKISSSHFGSTVNAGSVAMHISDANMAELFTDGVVYGVGEPDSNLWDNHNTVATASMLSDITGALGATAFRVWLQDTANISSSNDVSLIPAKMTELKNLIDGLARNGVEEIYLIGVHFPSATYANYYVNGVGWETGYSYYTTHNGTDFYRDYSCVPDPSTEAAAYAEWLKVQADYYSLLTAQIAVWKENSPAWNNIRFYFEGINEPEGQLIIHKRGSYSFGTGEYTYNYFNTATLAKVLTDVSYYMTLAVNANLGGAGYVTTSALMYLTEGSGNVPESGVSSDGLLGAMAAAIKDNVAPTAISGITPANTNDPEAYFTVLNWHPYLSWVEGSHNELYYATIGWVNDGTPLGKVTATVNSDYVADWVAWNNSLYNTFVSQFTGFAPKVVFSEFGMIDYGDYAASDQFFKAIGITEELAATVFRTLLDEGLDDLTFANNCTVIAFRLCDVESIFRAEQAAQGYLDIYVYGEGNLGLIEEDGTVKAIMREYYYVIHGDRNTAALQTVISGYYD